MRVIYPFIFILISYSCHKSVIDLGCSCNTDSVWHYTTYNNFSGVSYNATLGYDTAYKQNAWFIQVNISNRNYMAVLKVCNPEISSIKAITDTIPRYNGIPIRPVSILFAGKLKRLCSNESPCFGCSAYLPETLFAYVTIDSLKKL